ncbi:MAG: glycoside hydrolase family 2 protein [Actinobacteria bacterium]|nr:glycoside hydrolase family 2 protein [Actinomycetota bacterium]
MHTDLIDAGVLADPFIDDREASAAWVAACDWRYDLALDVNTELTHDQVELVVDGLDTIAHLELDGVSIGHTANMHRRHRFDLTGRVRPGVNLLSVEFRSPTRHAEAVRDAVGDWPSASGEPYHYVRKMASSWGWDWGPKLTTSGIWRAARLVAWSTARLGDIRIDARVDDDRDGRDDHDRHDGGGNGDRRTDVGTVRVDVDVVASRTPGSDSAWVHVSLSDPDGRVVATSTGAVALAAGDVQHARFDLDAGVVERWWPRSLGPQPRYTLDVRLIDAAGTDLGRHTTTIGFRTIELDTTPDDVGSRFTFVVNGVPMFTRGVNWIPDDVFPSRVTAQQVRRRLEQACAANVDLVRVWGGGVYESDEFYDTCDELGLLVWQDFAFACAAYPEEHLLDEVRAEVHDNVTRLHHHPSLALWNGNNECQQGVEDWGWADRLEGRPWGASLWNDHVPLVVDALDSSRPYWPGSPSSGPHASANADQHGCTHVWDVWNRLDYERVRDHACRFVAEFGWQAPPTWRTLERSITERPLPVHSPAMANHQKADDGDRKLARPLLRRLGHVPDDIDSWWYATQLMQARAARTAIEHFRSLRGHCMGTVWWQLNDCWPATSWSLVDGDGLLKPSWYAVRDAYADRLLTVQPRGHHLILAAVNDGRDRWRASGTITRMTLDGTVRRTQEIDVAVAPLSAAHLTIDACLASPRVPADEVLVVELDDQRAWWWFADDRELLLAHPDYEATIEHDIATGTSRLTVVSDVVVRDLIVHPDRLVAGATIDRQVVDLRPGVVETFLVSWPSGFDARDVTAAQLLASPVSWSVRDLLP